MKNKFLCIIPARGGSKGIKNKNIIKINGKPLIQFTIETAKKLKNYCDILVSTDSKKIKNICLKNKLDFYGFRPKKLANDNALTKDVVKYELLKIEKIFNKKYFGIVLLQPTCPVRDYKKILSGIKILKNKKYNSVLSISDVEGNHPYRMKILKNNLCKNLMNFKSENMTPRQKLPKIYIRSGSFYIIERNYFLKNNSLVGNKCYGFKVKGLETTNIDTKKDLEFFKFLTIKKKR